MMATNGTGFGPATAMGACGLMVHWVPESEEASQVALTSPPYPLVGLKLRFAVTCEPGEEDSAEEPLIE